MNERINGPSISNDFDLQIKNLEQSILNNNIPLYEVNNGTQEIIKIDLVFKTGRINEKAIGSSKAAISLIREGSTSMSSQELAYTFDYYGCSVKVAAGIEYSSITLVCLTRYFNKVWPIWFQMISSPSYENAELEKYKEVYSQKLKDQLSKNDIVSYRLITEKIFGSLHPYGYNTEPEHILALKRDDLISFYQKNCSINSSFLVLSGSYSKDIKAQITDSFESLNHISAAKTAEFFKPEIIKGTFKEQTLNDSQTSIKTGCLCVDRYHSDRNKIKFLNTVLGGYFGSRLMKNIREEKGYTYGIYSSYDDWKHGGSFYISTDVGNEFIDDTLKEIKKEIDILKNELLDEKELTMVKNYILGQSLHLIDGPFATAQLIKSLYAKDLGPKNFEDNVLDVKQTSANDIRQMARKYLHPENFVTVLAGKF